MDLFIFKGINLKIYNFSFNFYYDKCQKLWPAKIII